jgi:hypothetical protein
LEFEARYDEAGNRFVAFGRGGEACRCFWSGQEFGAILSLVQGFPEIAHDPRYLAARFLQNINPTWIQATQILERLVDFISREPDISPGELATWSQFVDQFIARLKTLAVQTAKAANEVDQAMNLSH